MLAGVSGGASGGQLGPQELGGPDDSVWWRCDQPSVAGDVGDPAVVAGPASPGGAGGANELAVEWAALLSICLGFVAQRSLTGDAEVQAHADALAALSTAQPGSGG